MICPTFARSEAIVRAATAPSSYPKSPMCERWREAGERRALHPIRLESALQAAEPVGARRRPMMEAQFLCPWHYLL
jgi:hypothetical protein